MLTILHVEQSLSDTPQGQVLTRIIADLGNLVAQSAIAKWLLIAVLVGLCISVFGRMVTGAVRVALSITAGAIGIWLLLGLVAQLGLV